MKYLIVITLAFVLYLLLWLLSSYFAILNEKGRIRKIFFHLFPIIQVTLWIGFTFWSFSRLFYPSFTFTLLTGSMILVLVMLFGWYFLRDFFFGVILRSEHSLDVGQLIHTSDLSGIIKKVGYRSIEILTHQGEMQIIPFSTLSNTTILGKDSDRRSNEFDLRLAISSSYSPEKMVNQIKQRVVEMPWVIADERMQIEIKRDGSERFNVMIHLHLLKAENAIKTEEMLLAFVNEVFP